MIKNKLSVFKTDAEKSRAYIQDTFNSTHKVMAHYSDGKTVPLSSVSVSDVDFIGGLWRVQNNFVHKIQNVRGTDFVLHERLPNKEKNHFEFYRASQVCCNCYGYFLVSGADKIVAKYTTDDCVYWSYGNTIEQARAFLGIRLYDMHTDLIHSVACRNCGQHQKK